MSLTNAQTQLQIILAADAGLIAWAQTHFNRDWTELRANRPVSRIRADEMPVRVYELDNGDTGPEVSGYSQRVVTAIPMAVGWYEQDYDQSYGQRTELIDLVINAVLANGTLNDNVGGAWVSAFTPDQSANHPKHFVTFTVTIEYEVQKS